MFLVYMNESLNLINFLFIIIYHYFIGTRYKRRGVNEAGHVANYVETEQVINLWSVRHLFR